MKRWWLIAIIIIMVAVIGIYVINYQKEVTEIEMADLKITSSAFENNGMIPAKYTADGDGVNPEISIGEIPENTATLVLIVDDPDAPAGTWTHWVVFNIDASTAKIDENSVPGEQGMNDFRKVNYGGPSPPSGTHRYFFKVFALDTRLELGEGALRQDVEDAMKDHILAKGELIGKYSR